MAPSGDQRQGHAGSSSQPLIQVGATPRTTLEEHILKSRENRLKILEEQLFTSTDDAEKERVRTEIVRLQTPLDTSYGISRIEEASNRWFYRENNDAYSILKGTDLEKEFLRLKYTSDRERFIKRHAQHHFVIGANGRH